MIKRKWNNLLIQFFSYLLLTILIIFSLFPAAWMILTSFKPMNEIYKSPPKIIIQNPTFLNYTRVLFKSNIPRAFLNSVVVAFFTILLNLVISILAAYGLTRYKFKGSETISIGMLFGQMLPAVVIVIPLYMIYNKLRLIDTYSALIIANLTVTVPMSVLMLKSFFLTIPRELEEAAKIDGCSNFGTIFRIIIPLAVPGIIAVTIYSFLHAWDEFLYALNFINSASIKTLPIAITEFKGQFVMDWGGMMSASVIISIPLMVLFLLCSKYFIKGLSEGAIKG